MYLYQWRRFGVLLVVALGLTACGVRDLAVAAETDADGAATGALPAEPKCASVAVAAPTEEVMPTATTTSTAAPDTTATAPVNTPTVPNDAGAAQSAGTDDTMTQPESLPPTGDEHAVRVLLLTGTGQVELLLTDTQGRRLGYDPATDTILEEIPYALYDRDARESTAYLFVTKAEPGSHIVTITGIGTGAYDFLGLYEDDNAVATLIYEEGSVTPGQTIVINVDVPATTAEVPTPPDVGAGSDITAVVNQPVTFNGTFSDINPNDTHTITWDFGDGHGASDTLTPTHTYTLSGVYTATLTVDDNTGFVVSDTLQVDVTDPGD